MADSPTSRSLKYMRDRGYVADVVERFNSFIKQRFDYCGCIDLIAFNAEETIGIQATSSSNRVSRLNKILENEKAKLWVSSSHRKLWLITWGKRKTGKVHRWTERIDEIRLEEFHV